MPATGHVVAALRTAIANLGEDSLCVPLALPVLFRFDVDRRFSLAEPVAHALTEPGGTRPSLGETRPRGECPSYGVAVRSGLTGTFPTGF